MIAISCQHDQCKKHGKDYKGNQRYRCVLCGKTFVECERTAFGKLRINTKEAATVLGLLLEGMSIRATERLSGVCRNTIGDLILRVGEQCERFMSKAIVDVQANDVQCDELWSFIAKKGSYPC